MMEDCGVMFETYHVFSNKESIRIQLEKYRVEEELNNTSLTPVYNYEEYTELANRVKLLFPDRKSVKATTKFYGKIIVLFCLFLITFYISMLSELNYLLRSSCGFISGMLLIVLGFNVMHDGSHYAISKYPKVNEAVESIWNSFGLWNSLVWGLHHVYAHHSFTGNTKYDPDMKHFRPFTRKYREDTHGVKKIFIKFQDKIITFAACVFPGMYSGQTLAYFVGALKGSLWSLKLPKNFFSNIRWYEYCLMAFSVYCLWKGLFLPSLAFHLSANIFYHINISGDHDTYENSVEFRDETSLNWAKMQICHSGNFKNNSSIWTHLFGGINYQIEHHLFPNMSHMHYEKIKPIVEGFCKEKGYPYVHHEGLFETYMSFLKNIKHQGVDKSSD